MSKELYYPEFEMYYPEFDLGEFRYAAARYVKLLIRARWKCEPGFLPSQTLDRWELTNIGRDQLPAWKLMSLAAMALARLNTVFIPRGSGGIPVTSGQSPEERLLDSVGVLVEVDGSPPNNDVLLDATSRLLAEEPIDWNELARWSDLEAIRDDLDQLPHPQRPGKERQLRPAPRNFARKSQWQDLYDLHDRMRGEDPAVSDAQIYQTYSKKYKRRTRPNSRVLANHRNRLRRLSRSRREATDMTTDQGTD